ncbi:MAG TPA: GNAT family N-acetyltransferase [Geobacteraceae bacterium]
MITLGREFYVQTTHARHIPFNEVSTGFLFEAMLTSPDSAVFVIEQDGQVVGGIGGTLSAATYNFDCRVVMENFWFITSSCRGSLEAVRLIRTLEKWSAHNGAALIMLGAFDHLRSSALGKLYTKMGYEASEHVFVKGVSQ